MKAYAVQRIPEEDYRQLRILAAKREVSINQLLLDIIAREVRQEDEGRESHEN